MDLGGWLQKAKDSGGTAWSTAAAAVSGVVSGGLETVRANVGGFGVFGSTASSDSYDAARTDEKHYFLIPDPRNESGHSLHIVRCLPDGVPPINDLPKRRLFHLPAEGALPTVEEILIAGARATAEDSTERGPLSGRLNELADGIDGLDKRLFRGALVVGGLVALLNPLAGAAVAGHAVLPSVGLLASKFGLRYAGDASDSASLALRVRSAETDVRREFRGAEATSLVNPILGQLAKALTTTEDEFDPLMAFNEESTSFGELDRLRLLRITCTAVTAVYDGIIEDPACWRDLGIGPEDVRYLRLLRDLSD